MLIAAHGVTIFYPIAFADVCVGNDYGRQTGNGELNIILTVNRDFFNFGILNVTGDLAERIAAQSSNK